MNPESKRRDGSPSARPDPWAGPDDEDDKQPFKVLSRQEVQQLAAQHPAVSPWRVVAAQAAAGLVLGALAWLVIGRREIAWSALYGAAAVVVPSALMARGMTSRLSSMTLGGSVVSFALWESAKIGVSVAMLALAPKWVPGLSWPALLVALIVCLKVYWVALTWRGRKKN